MYYSDKTGKKEILIGDTVYLRINDVLVYGEIAEITENDEVSILLETSDYHTSTIHNISFVKRRKGYRSTVFRRHEYENNYHVQENDGQNEEI